MPQFIQTEQQEACQELLDEQKKLEQAYEEAVEQVRLFPLPLSSLCLEYNADICDIARSLKRAPPDT
jgi:hypothetical protein